MALPPSNLPPFRLRLTGGGHLGLQDSDKRKLLPPLKRSQTAGRQTQRLSGEGRGGGSEWQNLCISH